MEARPKGRWLPKIPATLGATDCPVLSPPFCSVTRGDTVVLTSPVESRPACSWSALSLYAVEQQSPTSGLRTTGGP